MRRGLLLVAIGACTFQRNQASSTTEAGVVDGKQLDAPMGSLCVGEPAYQICVSPPLPTNSVAITGGPHSTNSDPLCNKVPIIGSFSPPSCIVVAGSITIGVDEQWTGTRPLVLVAATSISISARLDVSSHGTSTGPGSQPTACQAFAGPAGQQTGGAGGSFRTAGGDGGSNGAGTNPAFPKESALPTALRGGCAGQAGSNDAAAAGAGGGAVYLASGGTISITAGGIDASGAGGGGGPRDDGNGNATGGGGGGTGGTIVLWAQTSISAASGVNVFANGGGGGGGGCQGGPPSSIMDGISGGEPNAASVAAAGGLAGTNGSGMSGGSGGNGFGGSNGAGPGGGAAQSGAGGGGGGGAGYIHANKALGPATVSPAPA